MGVRMLMGLLTLLAGFAAVAADLPTTPAHIETLAVAHRLDGVVEAINQATVSAQTSGRITELPFDVDDYVEKGEVIVRFRDNEQRARYERAQAALSEARARHAEAKAEFDRIRGIYEQRLVAKADMDRALANFEAAKARLAAAEAALTEAGEQLEQTVVRAPYSGIVVERHVQVGELATVGAPLMTGLSLEHLRVVAEVPQSLIADLRSEPSATVILPNDESLSAASLRIFPYADPATHTFRVRAELPAGQHGVYPGMLVKVAFAGERRDVLVVPAEAIARRGEVSAVYVLEPNGQLHFRQVRTGGAHGDVVEVLSGLEPGERVVTDPVVAAAAWKAQREDQHEGGAE